MKPKFGQVIQFTYADSDVVALVLGSTFNRLIVTDEGTSCDGGETIVLGLHLGGGPVVSTNNGVGAKPIAPHYHAVGYTATVRPDEIDIKVIL